MKLWEILKSENIDKKYKDNKNNEYHITTNYSEQPILCRKDNFQSVEFNTYEIMNLEFEELNGWGKQKYGGKFYYIDYDGIIEEVDDWGNSSGLNCYNNYNYFSTKEKAEEVNKEQLLYKMMKKFYDENDGNVDLNDAECKYYISYNRNFQSFEITWNCDCINLYTIYFSTKHLAQRCIEEIVKPFCNKYYDGKFNG